MLRRFFQGSIRKKLMLIILFAAVPAFLILFISAIEKRNEALKEAEKNISQLVDHFAEDQRRITASIRQLLQTLTMLPDVKQRNIPICTELFASILRANPIYANINLLDMEGNALASALPFKPVNFGDRKHVQETMVTRDFSAGEFMIGRTVSEPIFSFAQPVLNDAGSMVGVIILAIRLNYYGKLFDQADFPQGSFFSIADHRGIRLFRHPQNPSVPLGDSVSEKLYRNDTGALYNSGSEPQRRLITLVNKDGIRRVVATRQVRLDSGGEPYMYMFAGIPHDEVLANAGRIFLRDLVFMAVAVLLAMATVWFMGDKTIGRHLEQLAAAAERFGRGDFSARLDIPMTDGETGAVAAAFTRMGHEIATRDAQRDLAMEALRKSEERFHSLFRNMKEGVALHSLVRDESGRAINYRIVDVNPSYTRILGMEKEVVAGRLATQAYGVSEPPFLAAYTEAVAKGEPIAFDAGFAPMGKHFHVSATPWGEDGFATIFSDITDQVNLLRALRGSEERFRLLVEQAPEAIIVSEAEDESPVIVNANAEKLFGCSREELLALGHRRFYQEVQPDGRPMGETIGEYRKRALAGEEVVFERAIRNAQGKRMLCEVRLVLFPAPDRKLVRASWIDITARKQAEESLQRSLEEKTVLLKEVHHRVKNNLQILMSLINLQADTLSNKSEVEAFQMMQNRVRSISLVHERLYRSSNFGAVGMKGYLEDLLDQIGASYQETARGVRTMLEAEDVSLGVDKAIPLGLLVTELITNAYKHAFKHEAQGELKVFLRKNGETCLLRVEDNGPGLPGSFEGGESATLGMQLVKALESQLRGRLLVGQGPGARFELEFPLS
ncbi:MAG: PAS domain S-box protein [Desulfovibrio sp.]|nr:PAS domain S-box protein [Desulfovibrio sp.]MBI4959013.1 PAS domain S-box protein [Desulfovibrio sp.]